MDKFSALLVFQIVGLSRILKYIDEFEYIMDEETNFKLSQAL